MRDSAPRSSTSSSSRSAARSRRAPGWAWRSCTASSPTTTARSRCRRRVGAGTIVTRAAAGPRRSAAIDAPVARAGASRRGPSYESAIAAQRKSPATAAPTPRRRAAAQAAHPRRRRRAVDARHAAHRAAARRLRGVVAANGARGDRDPRRSERVDLLLSDIRMPDVSGVEVLRAAKDVNRDIVAFMMTAFASTDTRRRGDAARRRGLLHQAVQHGRAAAEGAPAPRSAPAQAGERAAEARAQHAPRVLQHHRPQRRRCSTSSR